MNVCASMSAPVVTARAGAPIAEVARHMEFYGVGCVVVTEEETLLGIVTDRDIAVHAVARGIGGDEPVRTVMTAPVVTIGVEDDIHEAYRTFRRSGVRRLPVVDGSRVVGILTVDDMLMDVFRRVADLLGPVARSVLEEPPGPQDATACAGAEAAEPPGSGGP
ncbi:CBS domain-containing protein [Streptomyces lavendulae]|uniref:Inosine 5'-monophosphate dehydrogenase n=1 Tax=Streptomyces lavendulae subsp. lavendulae TaxID=58340 RepID=A0A2K8PPK0_STRLA|nr:CBS domain-containing protein [Streptomyces lavendulae]ATZ28639.1 inosine 5'-monophosphate dehydrogenase [Streptomyces lavendulae subsp. lavendulae]QUQ58464.1 Inosine-5'-monophosphate dehydrogenase [Streptomyces lavendulae subsp. lavendulae]